jgi:hypothetical protein
MQFRTQLYILCGMVLGGFALSVWLLWFVHSAMAAPLPIEDPVCRTEFGQRIDCDDGTPS